MNLDLFAGDTALERIALQDGELYYQAQFALGLPATALLKELIADTPWRADKVVLMGRTYDQPRLSAWYGDPGASYTYSGLNLMPLAWTERLLDIKHRVEQAANASFNSVLLNYYRNQHDSMGYHSDDEAELGQQPVIASLSLGEERCFVLKHKRNKAVKPLRLKLASGSLLLMQGNTQHAWRHGIDKETRPCGPRINLTFRRILT